MRLRTRYTQRLPVAPGLRLDIPMFEGSGTKVLDVSGKGNHGTITDALWTRDENGVAMSFNGTSAYINCGNDASLNITDEITIEAWVKPNGASEVGYIVAKGTVTGVGGGYGLYWTGTTDCLRLFGNGSSVYSNEVFVDNNIRVNVVVTVDSDGNVVFYRNGIPAGTNTITLVSNSENMYLGNRVGGTASTHYFNGIIDDVRIYAVALTADQIKRRYEQTKRDYVRAS